LANGLRKEKNIMRIIDLAVKDIRQILRDKKSLLFLLVMPIVFTFFFGYAFATPTVEADTRLKIGVVNRDPGGILSESLIRLLESSTTVRPVILDEAGAEKADAMVLKGDAGAVLIIPVGFSSETLYGETRPNIDVITDEETKDGQTVRWALQSNSFRLISLVETARLNLDAYESQTPIAQESDRQKFLEEAVTSALAAWENQPVSFQVIGPEEKEDPTSINPYIQFSPGMMVQFALFGLTQASMVLVIERRSGAMARMLTTPMRKSELIAGHLLSTFLVVFAQLFILVLFGQLVLHVNYFRFPGATLLIIVATSLWVASLGLLISALVKREDQVILFSMIAMMVFSALGGAWFSLEMVGGAFATVGKLMPSSWAMTGFQNIVMRGQGLESAGTPVLILLAYSVAFFGVAIWRFKFE
jgi:ABC-2 type transport system permease protein